MLPFKSYLIERVYRLENEENKQVEDTLNAYERYLGQENLSVYNAIKRFSDVIKDDRMLINTIEYFDNETKEENYIPVYVSFEDFAADAAYDGRENVIELYYKHFNKLTTSLKRNKIAHELLHAKQHYKKSPKGYRNALHKRTLPNGNATIRSKRGYYTAPNEFPVQLASITHEMDRQYFQILQHIKKGSNVKFWEKQRQGFIRLLDMFIRSPKINYSVLPTYLNDQKDFIETLFRNKNNPEYRKFYKDFKAKLYWYYQKLSKVKKTDHGEVNDNLPES
jgi:hypothetical protein